MIVLASEQFVIAISVDRDTYVALERADHACLTTRQLLWASEVKIAAQACPARR